MGNTILRGERAFEERKTREELEMEIIEDEDTDEGEKEYTRIWGVPKGDDEVGEGGKRKGTVEKEENERARKRRRLEKGEDREIWEMIEILWWRWGREVRWKEMNELEGVGEEDVTIRELEQREWEKKEELCQEGSKKKVLERKWEKCL